MKSKIISRMVSKGLTQAEADAAFTTTFEALKATIEADKTARVPGFGTFTKKFQEGRKGRNPSTGESIDIPAKDVVKFKPGKAA